MLSWSPERSQQSGRSIRTQLRLSDRGGGGEGGGGVGEVDVWVMQRDGGRRACGVGEGEIWMDDDRRDA